MLVQTTVQGRVVLAFFPEAREVNVLGSFNNWSTLSTPMTSVGDGLWHALLPSWVDTENIRFLVRSETQRFGRLYKNDLVQSAAARAEHSVEAAPGPVG